MVVVATSPCRTRSAAGWPGLARSRHRRPVGPGDDEREIARDAIRARVPRGQVMPKRSFVGTTTTLRRSTARSSITRLAVLARRGEADIDRLRERRRRRRNRWFGGTCVIVSVARRDDEVRAHELPRPRQQRPSRSPARHRGRSLAARRSPPRLRRAVPVGRVGEVNDALVRHEALRRLRHLDPEVAVLVTPARARARRSPSSTSACGWSRRGGDGAEEVERRSGRRSGRGARLMALDLLAPATAARSERLPDHIVVLRDDEPPEFGSWKKNMYEPLLHLRFAGGARVIWSGCGTLQT